MITLTSAILDYNNLFTAPRTVCNTHTSDQVAFVCTASSAYHMQPVVRHVVRKDSSAIKFDRV